MTRNRSTEYAKGITAAVPNAIQVADRWHLLRNLKEMLERALHEHWTTLKSRHASATESASAKRLRFPRSRADQERQQLVREKRVQSYTRVQFLKRKGLSQRRIARMLKVSRATIRQFYNAAQYPEREQGLRPSQLDLFIKYLMTRLQTDDHLTAHQLWKEVVEQGYPAQPSQVVKWLDQYRHQTPQIPQPSTIPMTLALPSRETCLHLLMANPETLKQDEQALLKNLLSIDLLQALHSLVQEFIVMIRRRDPEGLDAWLNQCGSVESRACHHFAESFHQDYEAIRAALSLPWSNGQTEGQVHRLKLLKCQMYGRANLDLLRIRVCYKPE